MRLVRLVFVVAAVIVATVAAAGCGSDGRASKGGVADEAAVPRTLVRLQSDVYAFAQDRDWIGWVTCRGTALAVVVRHVNGGTARTIATFSPNEDCPFDDVRLALAGDAAVFSVATGANTGFEYVMSASVARRGARPLETLETSPSGGEGDHLVGPRGDGAILIYGVATLQSTDELVHWRFVGGRVMRVIGADATRLRGVSGPALLDVASGRVAVVPGRRRVYRWVGGAELMAGAAGRSVQLHDARTGVLMRTIQLGARPSAVAISSRIVAVLFEGPPARIERYAVSTGRRIGATTLSDTPVDELDASLNTVVYLTEGQIRILDKQGVSHLVGQTSGDSAFDLSIEGRRIAWAEDTRSGARIRAVVLSDRRR